MSPSSFRTISLSLIFLTSTTFYPLSCKSLLTSLEFPHPSLISFVHTSSIAISLWFWTIFGLYKARPNFFNPLSIFLSLISTTRSLISMHALYHNPLPSFAAATLIPPALSHISQGNLYTLSAIVTITAASFTIVREWTVWLPKALFLTLYITLTIVESVAAPIRKRMKGSELQLQLVIRTWGSVMLGVWITAEEWMLRRGMIGGESVWGEVEYDELVVVLMLATGLLAFWGFVAGRAVVYRLSRGLVLGCVYLSWGIVYMVGGGMRDVGGLYGGAGLLAGGIGRVLAFERQVREEEETEQEEYDATV